MTRHASQLLFATALVAMLFASPAKAFAASSGRAGVALAATADDNIPGVTLPASPVVGSLDSATDTDDVYQVWLAEGDVISASLEISGAVGGFDPRLFLYGPGSPSLTGADEVALSLQAKFPKSFSYTARSSGYHFLNAWQDGSATPAASGTTRITWSVWRPVYRFYNTRLGTHFYTATEAERRFVVATLSSLYQLEGPAYGINPYTNSSTLWRFYKPSTGTHFYTADPEERARVQATLGHVYQYEGPAYNVSRTPGGSTVWRFYNVRNGTHFYSADASEVARVNATLGHIYRYEGPAFFIAP